jgi:hypothetical protein
MIGLLFFGAIGLWIWFAIWLGRRIPKWFNWKRQGLISGVLIPLILFAPVGDEVIAYPQVLKLCSTAKDYIYDEQFAKGKTRDQYGYILETKIKTLFPNIQVRISEHASKEYNTGIPLIRYFEITPSAGFLKIPAGSSGGSMPLILPSCEPRSDLHQLEARLQIQIQKRPQ